MKGAHYLQEDSRKSWYTQPKRQTRSGKREAANAKRQTRSGKREAANAKRQTRKVGTGNLAGTSPRSGDA